MSVARWDGALLTSTLLLLYLATLPSALPEADAGEFVVLAIHGGIPHPPGYPLLMLLLRAVLPLRAWFPVLPLLSAVSSVAVALAALVIHRVVLQCTSHRPAAWLATGMVFVSAPVWRAATTPEPFGLNLLQAALVLLACWNLRCGRTWKWAFVLGAVFGSGVCNHHSLALLAPGALGLLAWTAWRDRTSRSVLAFTAGGLLGLLPLAYLVTADTNVLMSWGDRDMAGWFWRHLLRRDYGTFSLTPGGADVPSALPAWLGVLPGLLSVVGLPLVLIGLTRVVQREARAFHAVHALSVLMTGVVFMLLARLEADETARVIIQRFYALPILLLAPWMAFGWQVLDGWMRSPRLGKALVVVIMVMHLSVQVEAGSRAGEGFAKLHVINAFTHLPDNAVVVTGSDADYLALSYGQVALGLSPSAVITTVSLWNTPWYRQRLMRAVPELGEGDRVASLEPVVAVRPVLFTAGALNFLGQDAPPTRPTGMYQRMLKPHEAVDWQEAFAENVKLFEHYGFPVALQEVSAWERVYLVNYWLTWTRLAKELVALKDLARAQEAHRMRLMLEPGVRPMQ